MQGKGRVLWNELLSLHDLVVHLSLLVHGTCDEEINTT